MNCKHKPTLILTLSMLEGRDPLAAGLGLAAFMLIRFPAAGSGALLVLFPNPDPVTLLGLAAFLTPAGFAAGGGWSMIEVIAANLTNIPLPISHSKYRSPLTLPSFFPPLSSSSTPIHSPGANSVWPIKRMVAVRPSLSSTVWPIASSAMIKVTIPWDEKMLSCSCKLGVEVFVAVHW